MKTVWFAEWASMTSFNEFAQDQGSYEVGSGAPVNMLCMRAG